jgi:hypothetical protein
MNKKDLPQMAQVSQKRFYRRKWMDRMNRIRLRRMLRRDEQDGGRREWTRIVDRRGWRTEELQRRRKSDKQKVAIAARLRSETTMSLRWIAERLAMGSWTHVSNLLGARGRRK